MQAKQAKMLAKLNTQVIVKTDVEDNDQMRSNRYHEDADDEDTD